MCVTACKTHVIANYITDWYMEATKNLSETLSIAIAIIAYVIISIIMIYVADLLDRKEDNKHEELN